MTFFGETIRIIGQPRRLWGDWRMDKCVWCAEGWPFMACWPEGRPLFGLKAGLRRSVANGLAGPTDKKFLLTPLQPWRTKNSYSPEGQKIITLPKDNKAQSRRKMKLQRSFCIPSVTHPSIISWQINSPFFISLHWSFFFECDSFFFANPRVL